MKFEHEVDLLRIGVEGDSIPAALAKRSAESWELVSALDLPATEGEKSFEDGEPRILFRLALFWKKPADEWVLVGGEPPENWVRWDAESTRSFLEAITKTVIDSIKPDEVPAGRKPKPRLTSAAQTVWEDHDDSGVDPKGAS